MLAAGEWSRWVWVTRIAASFSPAIALSSASIWLGIAGPGSMIATSPSPTIYEQVPVKVKAPDWARSAGASMARGARGPRRRGEREIEDGGEAVGGHLFLVRCRRAVSPALCGCSEGYMSVPKENLASMLSHL